ncbi:GntR family transcriptional regulator [Pseudokordiimonas caeni]|uniref:GntR family transcriptional regulator n=1 Tax=Pseudokordiimonas caeni TaxID=2997908 RepID=UPI0028111920|nr:GntR family transcriptional regulator [Pseudokordiimonas caeni]
MSTLPQVEAEPGQTGLVVRTLAERVFEIMRERIVTGRIPTSAPIRQDVLAAELGISKIPLREALARLEQEGLIVSMPNRGYFVRAMSADEADEIFALRLVIEPAAAAAGCLAATEPHQAAAREAFEALDRAAADNLGEVAARNRAFHTSLVRPAGRMLTTNLVERLEILSERYVIAHLQPAGREDRAHLEHKALLDAWLSRDGKLTESLLTAHIEGTLKDLRQQLAAR